MAGFEGPVAEAGHRDPGAQVDTEPAETLDVTPFLLGSSKFCAMLRDHKRTPDALTLLLSASAECIFFTSVCGIYATASGRSSGDVVWARRPRRDQGDHARRAGSHQNGSGRVEGRAAGGDIVDQQDLPAADIVEVDRVEDAPDIAPPFLEAR